MTGAAHETWRNPPEERHRSYLQEGYSLRSWLLTTDHKRIAILYLFAITFFFAIGAVAAALIAQLSGTLVAFLGIFGWGLFASTLVPALVFAAGVFLLRLA